MNKQVKAEVQLETISELLGEASERLLTAREHKLLIQCLDDINAYLVSENTLPASSMPDMANIVCVAMSAVRTWPTQ